MKYEFSAGGLVVRKKGVSREVLLIKDMNGSWTFPKGLIENGEKTVDAAKREVFEEVGFKELRLVKELNSIEYFYNRNGLIKKKVNYFLLEYKGKSLPKPQKEEGISEAKWIALNKATDIVGYSKTNRPLLEETLSSLRAKRSNL